MTAELQNALNTLYETDFVRWLEITTEQLRKQDYAQVDWDNLLEELEDMSRRERKALKSNLIVIFLHLLKWQYQPEQRSGSWKGSLRKHRRRLNDDLQDSPSLKRYLYEVFATCYANGRSQAADETALPLDCFPVACPYTVEQVLSPEFLPENDK